MQALAYLNEAFAQGHQGPGIRAMVGRVVDMLSAEEGRIQLGSFNILADLRPDVGVLVVATYGGSTVDIYDGAPLRLKATLNTGPTEYVRLSPDGKTLLAVTKPPSLWDVATGKKSTPLLLPAAAQLQAVDWSADGQRVLLQSADRLCTFSTPTGALESCRTEAAGAAISGAGGLAFQDGDDLVLHLTDGRSVRGWPKPGRSWRSSIKRRPGAQALAKNEPAQVQLWKGDRLFATLAQEQLPRRIALWSRIVTAARGRG